MQKYKVEVVKLQNYPPVKICRGSQIIESESPQKAVRDFIYLYLDVIEEPMLIDRGLADSEDKYVSGVVQTMEPATFFLSCKFKGKKTKPLKD